MAINLPAAGPTIQKHPDLDPSEDYAWLRQKGLQYIQELGSRLWTDYNIHDPGITLLEQLCYALTDLGYRASFSMADLLAAPPWEKPARDPARQGFFTAKSILTMNPLTVRDFRKLLIDLAGVRNGWLTVAPDAGGPAVYADCPTSALQYSPATDHPIAIRGLYDALIEFEDDERMGNLNTGKIFYNYGFPVSGQPVTALLELRLPSWQRLEDAGGAFADFRAPGSRLLDPGGAVSPVVVECISGNKADDLDMPLDQQARILKRVVYATFTVNFLKDGSNPASQASVRFEDVPLKLWFDASDPAGARKALKLSDLKTALANPGAGGPIGRYHALVLEADAVVADARKALQAHRNLCEDFRGIKAVAVQDVSVCADMDVEPSADIEAVLAEAYYQIDQYMSPDIHFYSLKQLLDQGKAVEDLFEGPPLENGFLDDEQVDATNLREKLYASDLIELLMDIPGVKAVRNLRMTSFDQDGLPEDSSEPWELTVAAQHQPRLYIQASKILAFKNGLPFLPDKSELNDLLPVIRGRHADPKVSGAETDLPVPEGTYRNLKDYFPLQYQLPLTYGVGVEGLPETAGTARLAQAKQLKAYLLFFEQLLVDYLSQLDKVSECFALDEGVTSTYFTAFIKDDLIKGAESDLYAAGFAEADLRALAETQPEFLDRRNRFLDHMLTRFAESFSDYALMLFSYSKNKNVSQADLTKDKVLFLKAVPEMGADRARAFDYTQVAEGCDPASTNAAGLSLRIRRILGLDPSEKVFVVEHLLARPRIVNHDGLLPICIPPVCKLCGEEDPYSFRLTVVMNGRGGLANSGIEWRRFAERAIRMEVPAHLGVKICWLGEEQLPLFTNAWCAWLKRLADPAAAPADWTLALNAFLDVFKDLKSVYPPAYLHDCVDGDDSNRVFLNQTIITSSKEK